jgi:centromere protein C
MFAKERSVMPSIKEVIRVPVEDVRIRTSVAKGKARPNAKEPAEEEEYEGWEIKPGTKEGEIVKWGAAYEEYPPADGETVLVTNELSPSRPRPCRPQRFMMQLSGSQRR